MKKLIIAILAVCVAGALGFWAYKVNTNGVTINGVRIALTNLDDYKSIVESNMTIPKVIADGTDEMEQCLSWSLDKEYDFSPADLRKSVELPISCTIDETRLRGLLEEMNTARTETQNAFIDTETKEIVPEVYGDQIDVGAAVYAIHEAADDGNIITLDNFIIYPTVLAEDLQDSVDEYWKHKNWTVYYDEADIQITVPDEALELTSEGRFEVISYDFIDECVDRVASAYNTVGKDHEFVTHNDKTVTVSGGSLGNKVDKGVEKETLIYLFENGMSSMDREPIYSSNIDGGFDTYVEVSLNEQHVWLWVDGEVVMDSDCVSGTKGTTRETPTGFWAMDVVMPGKTLYPSGEDKGTWVDRWMRFSPDGCGLHDAGWRSRFGGNIYLKSGSHGCVNLPPKFAFNLYEYAYVGLPVIVY